MRIVLAAFLVAATVHAFPVEVRTTDGRTAWVELSVLKSTLLNALGRRSLEQESLDFVGKTAVITRPKIRVGGVSYPVGYFTESDLCRLYDFGRTIAADWETVPQQTMASVGLDGELRRLLSWDRAYQRVTCAGVN
jgi:hypothetical protein